MNVRTNYPFDAEVVRRFKYENAVFVVFLTGKPFLRHTDPTQASAAIAFSPFHAAFPTVIPSPASCLSTGKTQPALAQDALVRVGTQEALHQHRKPRLLRLFPRRHLQRFVDLRQHRSPFAVGQSPIPIRNATK